VAWDDSGNYNIAEKEWIPGEDDGDDTGDGFLGGYGLFLMIILILAFVLILMVVILVIVMMVTKRKKKEEEEEEGEGIPEPQEADEQVEEKPGVVAAPTAPSHREVTPQEEEEEEGLPDPSRLDQEVLVPEIITDELPPELQGVHDLESASLARRSTLGLAGPRGKRPGKNEEKDPGVMGLDTQDQLMLGSGDPTKGDLNSWEDPTKDDNGPDMEGPMEY